MNELEMLTKRASEILGSPEQGQAFVDGFIKKAFDAPTFGQVVSEGFGKAIGASAIGLAAGGIAAGIGVMLSQSEKAKLHVKFQNALSQVKTGNRLVKAAPVDKVNSYAETIFKFAPHVAADPNLLGSLLSNMLQGESVDPMTIKLLTELEGRYKDNNEYQLPRV